MLVSVSTTLSFSPSMTGRWGKAGGPLVNVDDMLVIPWLRLQISICLCFFLNLSVPLLTSMGIVIYPASLMQVTLSQDLDPRLLCPIALCTGDST